MACSCAPVYSRACGARRAWRSAAWRWFSPAVRPQPAGADGRVRVGQSWSWAGTVKASGMSSSNNSARVPGQVMLRGLRCSGRHGDLSPTAPERPFVVDIALAVDLGPVSHSNSYADVVDLA